MKEFPDSEVMRGIRLLLTDVDGVLTDGRIHFDVNGQEFKSFHVHDGAGFVYWHRSGGVSGFISGRSSQVVAERGEELGVTELHLGRLDKVPVLEDIMQRHDLQLSQVAYVGDDLSDLPVLQRVGFAATVPNARVELFDHVHHVTVVPGGRGALRDVIEVLLKAQGKWDEVVRRCGLP